MIWFVPPLLSLGHTDFLPRASNLGESLHSFLGDAPPHRDGVLFLSAIFSFFSSLHLFKAPFPLHLGCFSLTFPPPLRRQTASAASPLPFMRQPSFSVFFTGDGFPQLPSRQALHFFLLFFGSSKFHACLP